MRIHKPTVIRIIAAMTLFCVVSFYVVPGIPNHFHHVPEYAGFYTGLLTMFCLFFILDFDFNEINKWMRKRKY